MTLRWNHRVERALSENGPGSYLVTFPVYRPDLVADLAATFGLDYVDFRATMLAPLGFAAHTLPLSTIETKIADHATRGLVLHNAEALLAAKPEPERLAWLQAFVEIPRAATVIVPLALFGPALADHRRIVRLAETDIPPQTLLSELASMRVT